MAFVCKICDRYFESIPQDAFELSAARSIRTVRLADDSIHVLYQIPNRTKSGLRTHARWHIDRGIKKLGCPHCYPEQTPVEPTPATVEEAMPEAVKPGVESATIEEVDLAKLPPVWWSFP